MTLASIPSTLYLHQIVTISINKKESNDTNIYVPYINGTKAKTTGKNFKFEVTEEETKIEFKKDQAYTLQVINNSTSGTFADYDEWEEMDDTYSVQWEDDKLRGKHRKDIRNQKRW